MTQYVAERVERLESPITAWILIVMIFALTCMYAYFVNGAVANIVEAKDMRAQISNITSSVGSLEAEYLAMKSDINLEYAHSLGYAESAGTVYVAKSGPSSLSFNR